MFCTHKHKGDTSNISFPTVTSTSIIAKQTQQEGTSSRNPGLAQNWLFTIFQDSTNSECARIRGWLALQDSFGALIADGRAAGKGNQARILTTGWWKYWGSNEGGTEKKTCWKEKETAPQTLSKIRLQETPPTPYPTTDVSFPLHSKVPAVGKACVPPSPENGKHFPLQHPWISVPLFPSTRTPLSLLLLNWCWSLGVFYDCCLF